MRVIVVSDRYLSSSALVGAVRQIPDAAVVAEVESMEAAWKLSGDGGADALMIDASLVDHGGPDVAEILAALDQEEKPGPDRAPGPAGSASASTPAPVLGIQDRHIERLSNREREVFALIGVGFSNQEIADVLGVSARTVKAHVGRTLRKLCCGSRLQLGLASFVYLARLGGD